MQDLNQHIQIETSELLDILDILILDTGYNNMRYLQAKTSSRYSSPSQKKEMVIKFFYCTGLVFCFRFLLNIFPLIMQYRSAIVQIASPLPSAIWIVVVRCMNEWTFSSLVS